MLRENFSFIFLLLALIAEIVGTIGGFGSSVFFVPIANFYLDFESVLGLTALFHVASNLSKIAQFKKGLNKKLVIQLGVPAVLFVIIGGILAKYFSGIYLEIALGVFLISISLLFLIKQNLVIKQGKVQAITGGVLSGFLAGLLGTGGAVRGLTMAAFNLEKSVFVATSAAIDFAVDFSRSIVYAFNGFIQKEILIYVPFLVIIGWVGTMIGKKILYKIPQENFKKMSLLLILGIGIVTFIRAILS
ncbi:MAG: sulfite exporter TauE/SafE family protein [Saprospiraceae bacterium]|nr:sulfite exporter TauE/SafE family protein [Bacteroidia bacterium]NNE16620.1 sulfite exporter TauE/SafE family protein [Saprospiraceae bacterium]NNL91911.1 sulfite exporter TauE/SafE family protein [Saprospiraceae bacterium]